LTHVILSGDRSIQAGDRLTGMGKIEVVQTTGSDRGTDDMLVDVEDCLVYVTTPAHETIILTPDQALKFARTLAEAALAGYQEAQKRSKQ
jgi:hypothetical protein